MVKCVIYHAQVYSIENSTFVDRWSTGYGRNVWKTETWSDLIFTNRTVQKFDIRSDGFSIETACSPPFR